VLRELFLLRAAKISLGTASWVETFTRLCSIVAGGVRFDAGEFVNRLRNASGGKLSSAVLQERVASLRVRLGEDFRQCINAHDLIKLLSWYAHQVGIDRHIYNEWPLQRGLMTSIELVQLKPTKLFVELAAWSAG
jgi:hypothetical protein